MTASMIRSSGNDNSNDKRNIFVIVPSSSASSVSVSRRSVRYPQSTRSRDLSSRRNIVALKLSTSSDDDKNNNNRQQQQNDDDDNNARPKIRFSGIDLDRDQTSRKSPLDLLFSSLTSDVTSIALGTTGLLILLVGRLVLDSSTDTNEVNAEALGQATRVNLLAVFACGAILLNGVSKLDIQSAMAERVQLVGVRQRDPVLLGGSEATSRDGATEVTSWVLESLLTASPASSVVLLQTDVHDDDDDDDDTSPWRIKGYAGIVPENLVNQVDPEHATLSIDTPILDRLRRATTESYLPTLQALPGRFEFASYLPANTQAVLLLPVVMDGDRRRRRRAAVVLGANQARTFTPRDIAWCQVVANRLSQEEEEEEAM